MLHACLYTICFVFCYTSWRFYAFFRTNLLTRCHSASSLFYIVLCFRKVTQEILSKLDETKAEPPIFTEASWRPKMRRKGARGQAHHMVARPSPWPHHHMVRPGGPSSDISLSPISSPRWEKPRGWISFPWNILQAAAIAVWYVSNVSIIFYATCLFIHHLLCVLLHFVAFLCIFWN
jgi:hypothetical protein